MKKIFFMLTLTFAMVASPLGVLHARFFADPTLPFEQPPGGVVKNNENRGIYGENEAAAEPSSIITFYKFGFCANFSWTRKDSSDEPWPDFGDEFWTDSGGESMAFNIGLDILFRLTKNIDLGVGTRVLLSGYKYQEPLESSPGYVDRSDPLILCPLFFVGKIHFFEGVSPFLSFEIGSNFYTGMDRDPDFHKEVNDSSLSGGIHYAIGCGVILSDFLQLEISWAHTEGGFSNYFSENVDFSHERVMISLGLAI